MRSWLVMVQDYVNDYTYVLSVHDTRDSAEFAVAAFNSFEGRAYVSLVEA